MCVIVVVIAFVGLALGPNPTSHFSSTAIDFMQILLGL